MYLSGVPLLIMQACCAAAVHHQIRRNLVMNIERSQLSTMDKTLSNLLQCMERCDFNSTCMTFRFFSLSQRCFQLPSYPEDIRKQWEIRGTKQGTFMCPAPWVKPTHGFSPRPDYVATEAVPSTEAGVPTTIGNNATSSDTEESSTVERNTTTVASTVETTTTTTPTTTTTSTTSTNTTTPMPTTTTTTTSTTTTAKPTTTMTTTATTKPTTTTTTTTTSKPTTTTATTTTTTTTTTKPATIKVDVNATDSDLIDFKNMYNFYRHRFCSTGTCYNKYYQEGFKHYIEKFGRVIDESKIESVRSKCPKGEENLKKISFKVNEDSAHEVIFGDGKDPVGYVSVKKGACGASKDILLWKGIALPGNLFYGGAEDMMSPVTYSQPTSAGFFIWT